MDMRPLFNAVERISDDQFNQIVKSAEASIEAVLSGVNNDYYPAERRDIDVDAYGALHSLITTASENDIAVIANDIGREILPLNLVNEMTVADLIGRMDDTTDGDQLSNQVDLNSNKSILVHRGAFHVWDITSGADSSLNNVGKGIDDYLEKNGRSVIVIGSYDSLEILAKEVDNIQSSDMTLADPSDATVINGQLTNQSDLGMVGAVPPTLGGVSRP